MSRPTIETTRADELNAREEGSCEAGVCRGFEQFVEERPDTAVLVALAAGIVVGVGVGAALGSPSRSTANALGLRRNRQVAEGLGERMISSLEQLMPQSISRSLGVKG